MSVPKIKETTSSNKVIRYSNRISRRRFSITAHRGIVKSDRATDCRNLIVDVIRKVKSASRYFNEGNFMIINVEIWRQLVVNLQTNAWEEIVHSSSSPIACTTRTKTSNYWSKMFLINVIKLMLRPTIKTTIVVEIIGAKRKGYLISLAMLMCMSLRLFRVVCCFRSHICMWVKLITWMLQFAFILRKEIISSVIWKAICEWILSCV
jgi:hypothetical protein